MNGHFSAMRNRQKISESKKHQRRNKIDKKKQSLFEHNIYNAERKSEKPNLTDKELDILKRNIKLKIKKDQRNLLIKRIFIIIIIVLITLILRIIIS